MTKSQRKRRHRSSRPIIHVKVLSNRTPSQYSRSIKSINSNAIPSSHRSTLRSEKIFINEINTSKWANPMDYAGRRQQLPNLMKRKFLSRSCLIASLISATIFVVILVTLLGVLLSKPRVDVKAKPVRNVTLRWKPDAITVAGMVNSSGTAANQLNTPRDLKIDYLNSIYIADSGNHRIQKYLRDAKNGTTIAGFSNCTASASAYGLAVPGHILLDSDENLYISDRGTNRIKFWKRGALLGQVIAGIGTNGNASNQLILPYGTARDPLTNIIYIVDTGNQRIMSYASGATSGVLFAGGTNIGCNTTQLRSPFGVEFDSFTNSLVITNGGCSNIVRWKLSDSNWTLLAGSSQGIFGNTPTLLRGPTFITFDPMGNMYVADSSNTRIQLFFKDQLTAVTIAGKTSVFGKNATLLNSPMSVKLDNQLNLYVADTQNHRIQKFLRY